MGTLGKDLFRIDQPFFEVTALFAEEWLEIEGTVYKYGELTTEYLNLDASRYLALAKEIKAANAHGEEKTVEFLRRQADEVIVALPLYKQFAGRKIYLQCASVDEYLALGEDIVLIQDRYAWFLKEMFQKPVGKTKGNPYGEQMHKNLVEPFVSGRSLGLSAERDPGDTTIQYEVRLSGAVGTHVLYEKLIFTRMLDLIYAELFKGNIHKCGPALAKTNAHTLGFCTASGHTYEYCPNIAPGETEKTCRDIGAAASFKEKVNHNPVWEIHQRAYKKYYARVMKKKMSKADFEQWAERAMQKRSETDTLYQQALCRGEAISLDEYRQALNRP